MKGLTRYTCGAGDGMYESKEGYYVDYSEANYWMQRCLLTERCLEESPCDPDITPEQIKAHNEYYQFIKDNPLL